MLIFKNYYLFILLVSFLINLPHNATSSPCKKRKKALSSTTNPSLSLIIASKSGRLKKVENLLSSNINPNIHTGSEEETPLILAIKGGHVNIAKALLNAKAHPSTSLINGNTPLHLTASLHYNQQILIALINAGACIEVAQLSRNPLHCSSASSFDTPLLSAIKSRRFDQGNSDALSLLIEHGANPNQRNFDGNSPLDLAIAAYYDNQQNTRSNGSRELISIIANIRLLAQPIIEEVRQSTAAEVLPSDIINIINDYICVHPEDYPSSSSISSSSSTQSR